MKHNQSQWPRRKFLGAMAGVGAATMMGPFSSWANQEIDPRVAAIVKDTIGVDSHNHVDVPITSSDIPGPKIDITGEMKKSGLSAICMTFAVDYQKLVNPGDGYERFKNGLTSTDQQLKDNGITRSLNIADLRAAHDKHQPTVIQSVEGGHFLEGKIERLDEAYQRGLRHLGLLHDNDASIPLGDVFTNPVRWNGLTTFGAEVIKACNRLGILIDVSHANNDTAAAALKLTTKPVIVSHTGLDTRLGNNENMARMMKPRLISKEQAKIVTDAGGVIGVWTHLSESAKDYAENIRALVDVAGVDHVCIGTDTKLTPSYRPSPQGEPKKGEPGRPQGERIGERTNRVWLDQTAGFFYTVVDAMLKAGFTTDEIGKIGGGNFCRVFEEATKD